MHCKDLDEGGRKIVDGDAADIADYPYQVKIDVGNLHICGGSILSETYVITAAHCFYGYENVDSKVRAGSSKPDSGGQLVPVLYVVVHPDFIPETMDNDVCILILSIKIHLNENAAVIELNYDPIQVGARAQLTGYGALSQDGGVPDTLQHIELPIISIEKCRGYYASFALKVTDNMFCIGTGDGNGDTCQGDSGGPAVVNGKMVGIVSWGKGCALKGYPGVYTSIPRMRGFIETYTQL